MTQALEALELANRTRRDRAEVKRRIKRGELTVAEVLADPPACCGRMSIAELLGAQVLWGPKRCRRLLRDAQVSEIRRVGDLTERQRNLIAGLIG
jgi:hypothetical protein